MLIRLAGALDVEVGALVAGLGLSDVPSKPATSSIRDLIRERDARAS